MSSWHHSSQTTSGTMYSASTTRRIVFYLSASTNVWYTGYHVIVCNPWVRMCVCVWKRLLVSLIEWVIVCLSGFLWVFAGVVDMSVLDNMVEYICEQICKRLIDCMTVHLMCDCVRVMFAAIWLVISHYVCQMFFNVLSHGDAVMIDNCTEDWRREQSATDALHTWSLDHNLVTAPSSSPALKLEFSEFVPLYRLVSAHKW